MNEYFIFVSKSLFHVLVFQIAKIRLKFKIKLFPKFKNVVKTKY